MRTAGWLAWMGAAGLELRAEERPRTYLAKLNSACMRDPHRNYYQAPLDVVPDWSLQSQAEAVDPEFLASVAESEEQMPVAAVEDVIRGLSFTASSVLRSANSTTLAGAGSNQGPPLAFEYLSWLDLLLVHNPHRMEQHQMEQILQGLPCTDLGPSPDLVRRVEDPHQLWIEERAQSKALGDLESLRLEAGELAARVGATVRRYALWGAARRRPKARHTAEDEDLFTFNEELPTLFQNGSLAPVFSATAARRNLQGQAQRAAIKLPSDALVGKQWYLYGPSQGVEFGANVVDAWAAAVMLARQKRSDDLSVIEFEDVLKAAPGMTVAIADSGCAENVDLLNKLEWAPGCPPHAQTDWRGHCRGYDYGNERADPTLSTESHGTQTAGLIAAESNNYWGIAATCPTCRIICLKIYNDDNKSLSTTAIVRAIEHIAKSGAKISNHSYGGFGDDRLERYAFERLLRGGDHLAFVAAGNAGCDIDCAAGTARCRGKRCPNPQLWTPASYQMPGLTSIASNTKKGAVSMFSNTGATSVHLFTPGSEIVSIDKRGSPTGTVGSGTSFASPIAAGIAAFIWSVVPQASALQVQQAILQTARYNAGFEGFSRTPGVLDAYAALEYLVKHR